MSAPGASATPAARDAARNHAGQRAFYWFSWHVVIAAFTLLYRLRRHDFARIPIDGPVLLVSNHQSHFDPPLLALCLRGRQLRAVARASLFRIPGFGMLIRVLNAVPIQDREGDLAALRAAADLLRAGEVIAVFPEGSRTRDGSLGEFKRGVTVLLRRARCVVIPCAIDGAFEVWPKTRLLPRLLGPRIRVAVGRPIDSAELMERGADETLALLRAEIATMLEDLRRAPAGG